MDLIVRRNAYGRQRESFEVALEIPSLGKEPFTGVFIRSPHFVHLGPGMESICDHGGMSVLARIGKVILSAFHPELTPDDRIHRMFVGLSSEVATS